MPDRHKIYQHLPSQHPPKFTQIGIFGLKTNHLATQLYMKSSPLFTFFASQSKKYKDAQYAVKKIFVIKISLAKFWLFQRSQLSFCLPLMV
jgi:hypothetical protein